eukprot:TRINITY_DN17351_c0_g1_i1.p1 TRINITY_DN17351_c0_g1~~TRINITY_DN17351_c0_g1_i1.p1  ORF type:complete len:303 (+),score=35.62 TRINITY_DN17351_c0_g1_i1:545-1453(+)
MCIGVVCLPESPRFELVRGIGKGDPDQGMRKAVESLTILRGSRSEAEVEARDLFVSLAEDKSAPWKELFVCPSIRRRVLIANWMQWAQQFTGINALLSFGPSMLRAAKVDLDIFLVQFYLNLLGAFFSIVLMVLIDRIGRRPLLLLSGALCCLSMLGGAFVAFRIEVFEQTESMGIPLVVCMLFYSASFNLGWGGLTWVYPSEIFPMDVKEKALATSVGSQWLANFVIAFAVPYQVELLGLRGTFLFFAVCLLVTFAVTIWALPETKGIPLEDMDNVFGPRHSLTRLEMSTSSSDEEGTSSE